VAGKGKISSKLKAESSMKYGLKTQRNRIEEIGKRK
jgi:hypothetical protein